jgi:hypothetical protein
MKKMAREPWSVVFSLSLYRALLAVYPSEFRQEYGGPMLQVFGDCCRRALREVGLAGLLPLWGRTALDTVQTAVEQHSQRGVDMSKEKFVKLAGWALVLGGLAISLGWMASSRPEYNPFNALSLQVDRYANAAGVPLIFLGLLLLSVGVAGLLARFGRAAGGFGRLSLGLGAVFGVVSAVGVVGLGIKDSDPWWSMFFWGLTFQFLGVALFGVVCLQRRLLGRWNGLPLLAGMWAPLFVAISLIVEQFSGAWLDMPEWIFYSLWLLSLAGLAGLGYRLQAGAIPEEGALQAA